MRDQRVPLSASTGVRGLKTVWVRSVGALRAAELRVLLRLRLRSLYHVLVPFTRSWGTVEMERMTRLGGSSAQGTMVWRLALAVLALTVTLPTCTSSILPASLGARLESETSLLKLAWSAVSSGLPRVTNSRILLADAAVWPCFLTVSRCGCSVTVAFRIRR